MQNTIKILIYKPNTENTKENKTKKRLPTTCILTNNTLINRKQEIPQTLSLLKVQKPPIIVVFESTTY